MAGDRDRITVRKTGIFKTLPHPDSDRPLNMLF